MYFYVHKEKSLIYKDNLKIGSDPKKLNSTGKYHGKSFF